MHPLTLIKYWYLISSPLPYWLLCVHHIQELLQRAFWGSKGYWRLFTQTLLYEYSSFHFFYCFWQDTECCPDVQNIYKYCQEALCTSTMCQDLNETCIEVIIRSKQFLHRMQYYKVCLNDIYNHMDCTMED